MIKEDREFREMKRKQKGWKHFRETSYAHNFALLTIVRELLK